MEFVYTENQIEQILPDVLSAIPNKFLLFHGSMGAGKTTLIKALVKVLGGAQQGNSPSFGLVNEYSTEGGALLGYHFDFFRIEDEEEALDIGLEEYLSQDAWIFMEWPEKISSLVPEDATHLFIDIVDPQTRKLTIGKM
jgi:tRNA threonylcarbamoyladenosine biosynthesis protein TsaE